MDSAGLTLGVTLKENSVFDSFNLIVALVALVALVCIVGPGRRLLIKASLARLLLKTDTKDRRTDGEGDGKKAKRPRRRRNRP
jgi:hypothetical protein